jgi:two-component system, NarL family, invasion response regulator UvrY
MINVLIADDHPVVRHGLRQIVAGTTDIQVAAEATNGHEVFERLERTSIDAVVLDLSMPGIEGLEILKQIRQDHPRLPVLVLTMHSENQFAIRALKAGAAGYLTKDTAPAELIGALRHIVAGGRFISPLVAEAIASHLGADSDQPLHERLSDREYQVLRMIADGMSTREIAAALSLSAKTVSTYRARVLEKMRLRNTSELTAYVVRNKLTSGPH